MLAVILRECKTLLKKRLLVFIVLLGAASAYSLLIGNLYGGHVVTQIPVIVCDLEDSAQSRDVIRAIDDVDTYRVTVIDDQQAGEDQIERGEAAVMVVIPPDFSTHLARGEQAPIAVISDGTNTLQQGYALNNISEVIGTMNAVYAATYYAVQGITNIPPVPVQMSIRVGDNPTNSYALFYLYGVMLTAAQIGIMLAIATSVHQDKNTIYHTISAIAAKEILYAVLSLASAAIGLGILVGVWHMPFKGSLLPFFGLYTCFAFVVMNMAVLVALYFKTAIAMVQCLVFYALPAFLLSGYIWPNLGMIPLWNVLSYAIPLHYIMMDFRSLALTGTAPQAGQDMVILGISAIAVMGLNVLVLKMRKNHIKA